MLFRSLSNILIFHLHVSTLYYGLYSALYAVSFILCPLFLKKSFKEKRIIHSLLFSISLALVSLMICIIFLTPFTAMVFTIAEGMYTGIFWVNVDSLIGKIQGNLSRNDLKAKIFRHYTFSWNSGALLGSLFGFFLSFLAQSDFLNLMAIRNTHFGTISMYLCFIRSKKCRIFNNWSKSQAEKDPESRYQVFRWHCLSHRLSFCLFVRNL